MQIRKCATLEEVNEGPYIEIRRTEEGSYLVSTSLTDGESLLTGPFPSASTGEKFGIEQAERRGIETLNVVYTGNN